MLDEGEVTADQLLAIKIRAHHLAGSGGTYGFHHISAAAFAAEDAVGRALIGSPDPVSLRLAVSALRAAIDDARESTRPVRAKSGGLWGKNVSFLWPRRKKHKGRIVVAEDDPDVADLLHAELTRRGYDVEVARDGIAAIATVWNDPPHLIILDRGLPMMSGASLFMELKQYRPTREIPVVVLSSLPASPLYDAPATVYHHKPFDTEELMNICVDLALMPPSSAG